MSREKFEKIVSSSPFELCTDRWPNDPAKYAWPGDYKHYNLQLAYDVCMDYSKEQAEQLTIAKQRIAELEKDVDILAQNHEADRREIERLKSALSGMLGIVADSQGVAGYHLNGEISEWGEFEEIDAAYEALKGEAE